MMQPQLLQPSWPFYNIMNSTLDQGAQFSLNYDKFSRSITTSEDSPTNSSNSYFPAMCSLEFVEFPVLDDEMQLISPMNNIEIADICRWLDASEGNWNFSSHLSMEEEDVWSADLSAKSNDVSELLRSANQSLILPSEEMEIDSLLSLRHLLKAYGEAMDEGQSQLAEVIVGRINQNVSPVGETLERVAFNLFQSMEKQGDYLKQESRKNLDAAFRAFYEIFPFGRLPHFAANSAILEAMPNDAETIHIVDFDIGEGIQWPPIIKAIGSQMKALRLTSVKMEGNSVSNPSRWKFEETKWRLHEYARYFNLELKMEELKMEELENYIEEPKKIKEKEWLAFNCMANLPHMGRKRNKSDVIEFLRVAQEILANSATYKGILAFGHGENGEKLGNSGYSSFFDENLRHDEALYESMECNFPAHFAEARLAMECLFLAPYVSSLSSFPRWEEIRNAPVFEASNGLEGWRLSRENLMEAKEIVKEGETLYRIRNEGQNGNEMILEWRGVPLVRVSTWM